MRIRVAELADATAVARLVNRAYEVESFFVAGDRTSADEVRGLMELGTVLVVEADSTDDGIVGAVYSTVNAGRGYFGMLAVDPDRQHLGIGRALIAACEERCRAAGCDVIDISVVNLRTDLLRFYDRLGYRLSGTAPYVHRPVIQSCHFVTMAKRLDVPTPQHP